MWRWTTRSTSTFEVASQADRLQSALLTCASFVDRCRNALLFDGIAIVKRLTKIGFGITVSWFVVVAGLMWWKFDDVLKLTPNEWGDLLSGVTAPLALIWLVIGYFLQGEELRLNTAALKAQEKELQRQVAETAILAANSARQAEAAERLAQAAKDEHDRAEEMALADVKPVFRSRGKAPVDLDHLSFRPEGHAILIENVGATVTKAAARTDAPGINLQMENADVVPKGNAVKLLMWGDLHYPFDFRIVYRDNLGEKRSQAFRMLSPEVFEAA